MNEVNDLKWREVNWQPGKSLKAAQLRLWDKIVNARLRDVLLRQRPGAWGVGQLTIDCEALQRGLFRIERADMTLPDGTHLVMPGNALAPTTPMPSDSLRPGARLGVFLHLSQE